MTRLKYERKRQCINQTVLAARVGLHQGDISLIERLVLVPTQLQLERISEALSTPVEDLLKEVIVVEQVHGA